MRWLLNLFAKPKEPSPVEKARRAALAAAQAYADARARHDKRDEGRAFLAFRRAKARLLFAEMDEARP